VSKEAPAFFVYAPPMRAVGAAPLPLPDLLLLLAYPVIIWSAVEFMRHLPGNRARRED